MTENLVFTVVNVALLLSAVTGELMIEAGKEIWRTHLDDVWYIGVTGQAGGRRQHRAPAPQVGAELAGGFLDAERPVDIGRFHEEIVGARAFVVLGRPTAHPFVVGNDADGAAADGAAQSELEGAGAGGGFVRSLPVNAEPPGLARHVAHGGGATALPRPYGTDDRDDRTRLRGLREARYALSADLCDA